VIGTCWETWLNCGDDSVDSVLDADRPYYHTLVSSVTKIESRQMEQSCSDDEHMDRQVLPACSDTVCKTALHGCTNRARSERMYKTANYVTSMVLHLRDVGVQPWLAGLFPRTAPHD
jgi:hypothetical protein